MAHYYSLQILCFVTPFAGLAVYYFLTLFDEIQCEVGEPRLLRGYSDTMVRMKEKIEQGSRFSFTES